MAIRTAKKKAPRRTPPKRATSKGAAAKSAQAETQDSPLLDMSDKAVKSLITRAKKSGYVTYDELNKVLPSSEVSTDKIEDTMATLSDMGINVIEADDTDEDAVDGARTPAVTGKKELAKSARAATPPGFWQQPKARRPRPRIARCSI